MPFTVAIVGRPNVGKSTLFNRLLGRRAALVDDRPGVTRDRREALAQVHDLDIKLIDTAGLEEVFDQSLEGRMRKQTERAVADADLVLLLIDARSGLTPLDEHFARWLRRSPTPVALVANKCESRRSEAGLAESYGLGLGEPIPISAEHGEGMADLYRLFVETMERAETAAAAPDVEEERRETEPEDEGGPLQLAIVGRPNVGKSTLVNKLLGEERMLTGPEAGITRDAIAVEWQHRGRPFRLIDTAGLRRRAKVADKLEKLSAMDSMRAVNFAQVVVLLVDAENPLEKQDLTIARTVVDEGRALVIAINKWDACQDRQSAMRLVVDRVQRSLPQSRGIAVVPLSALRDRNFDRLLDAVLRAYDVWTKRVPTAQLNRWLETATASHPPPAANGRRVRLKYIAQIKSRPPTFAIFCSRPSALPRSYLRYLENGLREAFDLPGTPIRLTFRKGKNPYGPTSDARA